MNCPDCPSKEGCNGSCLEPETAADYEDVKASIKQMRLEESKRENWPECPLCSAPMKSEKDKEMGDILVCTNKKCYHWEG